MNKPSVLLVTSESYPAFAGDGLSAFSFAKNLGKYGNVALATYSRTIPFEKKEKIENIYIFRVKYSGRNIISKIVSRIRFIIMIISKGRNYSTWLTFGLLPGVTLLMILGRLMHRKIIFRPTLYGFDSLNNEKMGNLSLNLIQKLSSGFFIRNSKMISPSYLQYHSKRIFFSSQGVQVERFRKPNECNTSSLRQKYSIPQNAKVLLMVGHLNTRKGFPEIAQWISRIPEKPFLVQVGGRNTNTQDVPLIAKEVELTNKVKALLGERFIPFPPTHEVEEFYWLSDIFLMASYVEGFPSNALLEAMASSTPVLCRKIEGYDDYMKDSENALLYSNETEFRTSCNKLLSDNSFALQLAQNAYTEIIDKHNIDNVSRLFIEFASAL